MKTIIKTPEPKVVSDFAFRKKQIKLHFSNSFVTIPVDKIIRLEGDCNYTVVYTESNSYVSARTLKHYEGILDSQYFIRVHKSHIVNIRHVKGFTILSKSSEIALKRGVKIEVSRRKLKGVVEKFETFKKS